MGWGGFLDKLFGMLPIQDRRERIKNKLEDLRKERNQLLREESNVKTSKRISIIDNDIVRNEQLLRNLA